MSQVTETTKIFNAVNYGGLGDMLYTADMQTAPILSLIGGVNGERQTGNSRFPVSVEYDYPAASQPAITEDASLTAPDAITFQRDQDVNVTQIFQEKVAISYAKQSNPWLMSGPTGFASATPNELDFQAARAMTNIIRKVEFSALAGVYNLAATSAQANQTRGLLNAVLAGNIIDAADSGVYSDTVLDKAKINDLLAEMAGNGALFGNMVAMMSAKLKQKFASLYEYVPQSRSEGGASIDIIYTDFGPLQLVWHRYMDAAGRDAQILFPDMSVVFGAGQPVPGKGNFFMEELAKTGAGESYQIFGQWGLGHGPNFAHGLIDNVTVA